MSIEEKDENIEKPSPNVAMTDVLVDGWIKYWGMVKCTEDDYIE